MAFGDGVELSYTIRDAKGKATSFPIAFPPNTDVVVLRDSFAPSTAELLDPLIDGVIEDANASINVNLDGVDIKDAPIVGADVEEGATFSYRSTAGAPTGMRLPTFDETFGLETGTGVDTGNADVAAFIARVVSGDTQGLTTVRFADSHGNNVSAFQKAEDNFRKSRKRK